MKYYLCLICLPCLLFAAGNIVFQENFESLTHWRKATPLNGAEFAVKDHRLVVSHKHLEGGGGFIEIPVPVIRKGQLDFDVEIASMGPHSDGISLTLDLYNISTFWHDACRDWRMYFAEPDAKRLPYFFLEPVGHRKICGFAKNRVVHCRIRFDADADLVEFYADDMRDPAAIRYDVSVLGHALYQGGYLRIGSFGYIPAPYQTMVSHILLTENTAQNTSSERRQVVVFEGMACDHYPMKKLIETAPENYRSYRWDSSGASVTNRNNYQYFRMPGFDTVDQAKVIIFNDAPNVPETLQKRILAAVDNGAHLLMMGGLCTLTKGNFQNSPLGNALPVALDTPWALTGDGVTPFIIQGTDAVVWYLLDLPVKKDAEILRTAGGKPILIRKSFGKGTIAVLTATACGPDSPQSFWKNTVLNELVTKALNAPLNPNDFK